jgi:hypothetical protein
MKSKKDLTGFKNLSGLVVQLTKLVDCSLLIHLSISCIVKTIHS